MRCTENWRQASADSASSFYFKGPNLCLLALVRDTSVGPHLSPCFNFKPTHCSFSKRVHSIPAVPLKAFSKFVIKKKKNLFSPFKTIIFNRNLPLHNSRVSPFHNKWLLLGLFLILHLRCVLVEELVKFQGLDRSTRPARPEYARPVPGDATAPGPRGSHREGQRFYCLLCRVVVFTGGAGWRHRVRAARHHQHLSPWWNFNFI